MHTSINDIAKQINKSNLAFEKALNRSTEVIGDHSKQLSQINHINFKQLLNLTQEKIDKAFVIFLNNKGHLLHRNILTGVIISKYKINVIKLQHVKSDVLIDKDKLTIFIEIPLELEPITVNQDETQYVTINVNIFIFTNGHDKHLTYSCDNSENQTILIALYSIYLSI
ncbi:unnamed protein product [Hermetia illucens]|uniref:Uncharacterized protein n=1 Tax=Hermetia illucens TaxID=343691 RepID=A0A7R8UD80_HERIL|nr:unnamed protein product [Hermetia illucens]